MTKTETFEGAGVVIPQTARLLATHSPAPISFTMANWPNDLGEQPVDAIGKSVTISMDDCDAHYVVDSAGEDGRLFLRAS